MSNWRTIVRNPKNLGAINLRGGGIAKRGTGQALKSGGRAALRTLFEVTPTLYLT